MALHFSLFTCLITANNKLIYMIRVIKKYVKVTIYFTYAYVFFSHTAPHHCILYKYTVSDLLNK